LVNQKVWMNHRLWTGRLSFSSVHNLRDYFKPWLAFQQWNRG
jgi:hypothetical protein